MKQFSILLLAFFISCGRKNPDAAIPIKKAAPTGQQRADATRAIEERLRKHFDNRSIVPSIEINNTTNTQTQIELANHTIKWYDSEAETKISIDGDLFSLKDKVTLNRVRSHYKDSVEFANNWDQIKLFRHRSKEYIGIRMQFYPCTGLGCSVNYFLIYDVATKSKSFFGTFRVDDKLELYDFANDDKVDYVSKTYNGDHYGATPIVFIYELYSRNADGKFTQQHDGNGRVYQITHTTFPNDTTKTDTFVQHWITEVR